VCPGIDKIDQIARNARAAYDVFGSWDLAILRENHVDDDRTQFVNTDFANLAIQAGVSKETAETMVEALRKPSTMTPGMRTSIQNLGFDVGVIMFYKERFEPASKPGEPEKKATAPRLHVNPLTVFEVENAGKALETFLRENGINL
jgi:hypothetical protein